MRSGVTMSRANVQISRRFCAVEEKTGKSVTPSDAPSTVAARVNKQAIVHHCGMKVAQFRNSVFDCSPPLGQPDDGDRPTYSHVAITWKSSDLESSPTKCRDLLGTTGKHTRTGLRFPSHAHTSSAATTMPVRL